MKKYLEAKYIFAILFGLAIVYIVNKNVDLLFQSRIADAQPIPMKTAPTPPQGKISTH